ncbi:GerW family sporulation protein [Natrinema caseinilyticum]|uniref:GerW family sporulation protein n=1 Tax=Natrinema caseinilyticum TaxID=2961570 RepID=UPI003CCDF5EE
MSVIDQLTTVVERLHGSASVESVYGDPIETNGRTIVPVAKIAYGFGAGYGSSPDEGSPDEQRTDYGDGGGLGGGVAAKPAGVVEITESETKFVRPTSTDRRLITLIGCLLVGYLLGRRK